MTSDIRLSELIASRFYPIHRAIKAHEFTHYDLSGGRGSTKSSFVSLEVLLLIKRNPSVHALVLRKVADTLRDSVYAQYLWAIGMLSLESEFRATVSPMEITYLPTGQKILFRGTDKPEKIKSIKVPFGYIGITHFEEKDQFAGRAEIRSVLQSTMRGGDRFWNFETYNPPISRSNWANADTLLPRPDRLAHKSCYTDVPAAWLGEQFVFEAEQLKAVNPRAYEHEYLGVPTGTGGNVFENLTIREITAAERKEFDRLYYGGDWGYFPDPFAWNKMHFDSARRVLYVLDELTMYKASNRLTADAIKAKGVSQNDMLIMDSAEPKSISDYRDFGLYARGAEKGPGSVDYSMKWLQSLREIVIDPKTCPDTAKEFTEYEYERTRDGEIISGYPDAANHHIDAVRYGVSPVWKRRGR